MLPSKKVSQQAKPASVEGTVDTGSTTIIKLRTALGAFQTINDNITVSQITSFLTVAQFERRSLREYAQLLDRPQSTTSRHLLDLGVRNRKREPGLGLIDQQEDPEDSRRNVYTLTGKGRRLIETVSTVLEQAQPVEGSP